MHRFSREDFIVKARAKHGDLYDYTDTIFSDIKSPIIVKCKSGHQFTVRTETHLRGGIGCPTCAGLDFEGFIVRANEIHKRKYDYSISKFVNTRVKIEILCPQHGLFWQTPVKHTNGRGCPKCAGRMSNEDFIEKSKEIHGNEYCFEGTIYTNPTTNVLFKCETHGIYEQLPREHLKGAKCPKCRGLYRTTEDFIKEATATHINRYDYSLVRYTKSENKVDIICHKHGIFKQPALSHLRGSGCSKCSCNVSKAENRWLDYLNIPVEYRHKQLRIDGYKRPLVVDAYDPITKTVYEFYGDFWHGNPEIYDQTAIHRSAKSKGTYGDLYQKTLLREQRIKQQGYNLVTIWESDWNKINKL